MRAGSSLVGAWADSYGDGFVVVVFAWGTHEAEQTGSGVRVPCGACPLGCVALSCKCRCLKRKARKTPTGQHGAPANTL